MSTDTGDPIVGETTHPAGRRQAAPGYGRAMLVTIGWYATILATVVVGAISLPQQRSDDCSVIFSCVSSAKMLEFLALLYGLAVFLGALFFASLALWVLRRFLRSPALTCTLAAALGLVGVVAVIALYLAGHR